MTDIQEARRREESFIGNLSGAQDDYVWIVSNRAWTALGWDSFADWWVARIQPVMRALSMRPTREIAAAVVEQVRQEEAGLPPAQRRTQRELAEMVGVDRSALASRDGSRSTQRETTRGDDLDQLESLTSRPDVEGLSTSELSPEEEHLLAEQEDRIQLPLDNLDRAIYYALSNRVDPMLIVGWLTAARQRLALLGGSEPSAAVNFIFDLRINHLLNRGRAIAQELAGPDLHRKPLTEDELAALATTISGGTA